MKTLLFVDDEPKVLQGLQRQLRPMRHEWEMNFAEGGEMALAFMAGRPADIIVTDMMMPGMDGSQLLGEVIRRHPQTVRIILSGQAGSEAILRLVGPAHQYLSKPCNPDELRKAITRALALRDLLGNQRLKELTTRIKNLPSLPALQNKLAEELDKNSPSVECVGDIISHDIAMTAKILQLVNSAFFGLAQPINNPVEAAIYLGLNTIHSLVLSSGIFSQYDQKTCQAFSLETLAQHSWLTGVLARRVARVERQEVKLAEQCFLAGLLHDVGQLILASGLREEYAEVIGKSRAQGLPVWQVEQEYFGATHADVGAYLLALWGLSNPITEAVALHHQPSRCASPEFSPVIAVHAADVLAHEFSRSDTAMPPSGLDLAHLTSLGLAGRVEAWRAGCQEEFEN
jgi:HD-like signal output (HDOD) protein/CheY-like chemotaxis protein